MQKNKADFQKVGSYFSPGLNVMYGDAKGNIAWWATGKLYKHNDGVDTHFILDGSSGKDDITEYMDFSKNPSAVNPEWNFVYSIIRLKQLMAFYILVIIFQKTELKELQLLEPKSDWTKESVGKCSTIILH
jgi:penicillin amidase